MNYDEGEPIGLPCPHCDSEATNFEPVFGYWKCEDCSTVWGSDEDDPDYDDAELCPNCHGTGVDGTEGGDPDMGEEYTDLACQTCGGSGYATSA